MLKAIVEALTAAIHKSFVDKAYGITAGDDQQLRYHFRLQSLIYACDPNLGHPGIWRVATAATAHLNVAIETFPADPVC
jgi:hypothetical protein